MSGLVGLRCGDVADAIFPSNFDRTQRNKVALAMVELARAIAAQGIEAATADETRSGSAVGESPVTEGHAPEGGVA